jgi:hypothetical protein
VPLPAAKGITRVMGLFGYACAMALLEQTTAAIPIHFVMKFMHVSKFEQLFANVNALLAQSGLKSGYEFTQFLDNCLL